MKKFILTIAVLVIGVVVFFVYQNQTALAPDSTPSINSGQASSPQVSLAQAGSSIFDKSRITKKPFGIYITPQNSPVQPEKFTGYHTGADFETTLAEANIDVSVLAFCDGKLLEKKYATGYGGVVVQSCNLTVPPSQGSDKAKQAVTVIYGHLKLASIVPIVGQTLKKGDLLGVLGKGYSTETDGERKHLHLGIHIGSDINILGYVQKQSDLSGWFNPVQFLK
jgi:murein DD-endopeptidase MepM/ murein hydrolase activator NlpD